MTDPKDWLRLAITNRLVDIEAMLPREYEYKLTLVARAVDNADAHIIVTNDDLVAVGTAIRATTAPDAGSDEGGK